MKRNLLILAVFSLMTFGFASIAPNIAAQTRSYRVSDQTVKSLITRIQRSKNKAQSAKQKNHASRTIGNRDFPETSFPLISLVVRFVPEISPDRPALLSL